MSMFLLVKGLYMLKSFISPGRYVQGAGALAELPALLPVFGRKVFVLLDPGVEGFMRPQLEAALGGSRDAEAMQFRYHIFGGESTESEMRRAAALVREGAYDVVVGVGGGKAIDTAKGAVYFAQQEGVRARLAVVPSIVASDAPCSKNAVVYTEDHRVDRDIHGLSNPDIVLIDSNVIAAAPVRFLSAGIGDALATWFEAEAVQKTMCANFTGYSGTLCGFAIARLCYDTLLENAPLAVRHCEEHLVTPQLDAVIEANSLMSTIGFESGGLASCHGFHQGIAEWGETHDKLHGEKVAIGILASLFLTHKSAALIAQMYQFCQEVRLPLTLEDLGVSSYDDEYLMVAVRRMMEPVECTHNEPVKYEELDYLNALKAADAYGRRWKDGRMGG